jgi:hypothetical protein
VQVCWIKVLIHFAARGRGADVLAAQPAPVRATGCAHHVVAASDLLGRETARGAGLTLQGAHHVIAREHVVSPSSPNKLKARFVRVLI